MRRHGPELNAKNAIGAPYNYLGNKNSWIRRRKQKTSVQSRTLSPLLSPPGVNKSISEDGPLVMAHRCLVLARECHNGSAPDWGPIDTLRRDFGLGMKMRAILLKRPRGLRQPDARLYFLRAATSRRVSARFKSPEVRLKSSSVLQAARFD